MKSKRSREIEARHWFGRQLMDKLTWKTSPTQRMLKSGNFLPYRILESNYRCYSLLIAYIFYKYSLQIVLYFPHYYILLVIDICVKAQLLSDRRWNNNAAPQYINVSCPPKYKHTHTHTSFIQPVTRNEPIRLCGVEYFYIGCLFNVWAREGQLALTCETMHQHNNIHTHAPGIPRNRKILCILCIVDPISVVRKDLIT